MPRPKIALFVGSDVAAHLIMNNVVKEMDAMGFEAVLYLPKHPKSQKAQLPELQEGAFYERTLLNETVYPFIEDHFHNGAKNLTPQQLADRFDIHYQPVENVNDPEFIQQIVEDEHLIGAISIRCFQIFKKPIIDALYKKDDKNRKIFLNLHPGLLPEYRGVMSTARRMFDIATGKTSDGSKDYGCTIHRVDEEIDTGNVLDSSSQILDTTQSAFMANIGLVKPATRLITQTLQKIKEGEDTLYGTIQAKAAADYFTYPTPEEIQAWKAAKLRLIEPTDQIVSLLVDKFSKAGSPQGQELERVIRGSIHTWQVKKASNGIRQGSFANDAHPTSRTSGNDDGPISAIG